jgi:hypothetical protein
MLTFLVPIGEICDALLFLTATGDVLGRIGRASVALLLSKGKSKNPPV